ncbi:ECF transporter S component [Ferrimonas lipolytica]|uniref:ECF transporter S component n=2 Tax=Ferrimonas lipolytica TaxID=2724191 RepID=A0A6H1UL62_9GAMM|nr:ECF transporter S component [Ferrimonas lipolytica]
MVVGIAINMSGGELNSMLKLPLFMDSIGSIIVALLAGPWAALCTGLTTNLIWGLISGPVAAAFAPVAGVIGLVAGLCAQRGGFKSFPKVLLSGVLIALALTLVAAPIRAYLFGGATGSGADFIVAYFTAVGDGLLQSVALTVIGANLADKIIACLIAWQLVRRLPQRSRNQFDDAAAVS